MEKKMRAIKNVGKNYLIGYNVKYFSFILIIFYIVSCAKCPNNADCGDCSESRLKGPTSLRVLEEGEIIELAWNDNSGSEDGYYIERKVNDDDWQTIATLAANSHSHIDSDISTHNIYVYRVYAYRSEEISSPSNSVMVMRTLDFEWRLVEKGEFFLGAENTLTTIDYDYYINKYEVTNAQFATFLTDAFANGEMTADQSSVSGLFSRDGRIYEIIDLDDLDCRIAYDFQTFSVDTVSKIIRSPKLPGMVLLFFANTMVCQHRFIFSGFHRFKISAFSC
jgi:hypothetical protein